MFPAAPQFNHMPHRPLLPFYSSHILHNNKPRKFSEKTNLPDAWTLSLCQFGEHLLPLCPKLPCALVKAEQTAVICSAVFPEFLQLATVDWVVEKRDGRRGISNTEKVLDAVKDYVKMGEVWA